MHDWTEKKKKRGKWRSQWGLITVHSASDSWLRTRWTLGWNGRSDSAVHKRATPTSDTQQFRAWEKGGTARACQSPLLWVSRSQQESWPRATLLILGGFQVYPAYQWRFTSQPPCSSFKASKHKFKHNRWERGPGTGSKAHQLKMEKQLILIYFLSSNDNEWTRLLLLYGRMSLFSICWCLWVIIWTFSLLPDITANLS